MGIVTGIVVAGCAGGSSGGGNAESGTTESSTESGTTESSSSNVSPEGTLVIGSGIPYKPFEYRNQQGELIGFDVEIAEAVFGELGWEMEFQKQSFDVLIQSLENGNIDAIMSALTITEERKEKSTIPRPTFKHIKQSLF